MKEKKKLYEQALELLEGCNSNLTDEPQLKSINISMALVIKNLNDVLIKAYTGLNSEEIK